METLDVVDVKFAHQSVEAVFYIDMAVCPSRGGRETTTWKLLLCWSNVRRTELRGERQSPRHPSDSEERDLQREMAYYNYCEIPRLIIVSIYGFN